MSAQQPPLVYWFPVRWVGWGGVGGGQMTSHMEESRRNAAHVGKILISASDYPWMKVRIINNSGGLCIISHCTKEEGRCGDAR